MGQTGPGGVSTDLELWFKADAGAESDGSNTAATNGNTVQIWQNQAPDHPTFDANQTSTPGGRPTFSTDAANTINGNPVLIFGEGGSDYFPIENLEYTVSGTRPSAITIFLVLATENADEGIILSYDRNQYFRFATDHEGDGGFGLSTTQNNGSIDDFNASSNGIEADGIPHILGGRFDPSIVGTNKYLFFDGTIDNSRDAGTSLGATTGATDDRFGFLGVGSEATIFDGDTGPDNYLEGNLAEVIYFDRALDDIQRQQVETYLAIKYGITLSSDTDGDGIAFETGGTIDEGDYLAADGTTVIWLANSNQSYHNNIAGIALDGGLAQSSSTSIEASSILTMTDAGLAENDYVLWGSNGGALGSNVFDGASFERKLNRVWKLQITGSTDDIDNIAFDLSGGGLFPADLANIGIIIDDEEDFADGSGIALDVLTNVTNTMTFSSGLLSIDDVDFSAFTGDVYITVAFNLDEPAGIATAPVLWYRADTGVKNAGDADAIDGDDVAIWENQSGSGNNADQTLTSASRPLFSSDPTNTINGNPVLSFDGDDDYFPITDLIYSVDGDRPEAITVYSVLTTQNEAEGVILSYDRNQYFRFAADHEDDGGFGLSTTENGGTTNDFNASSNGIEADGIPHILGGQFDPSIVGLNKYLLFDGTVNNSVNAGTSLGATTGDIDPRFGFLGVGSEATEFDGTAGPTNYLEGNLAEVMYFDAALDATERQQVETYLAIKYGVTLSSDTDGDGMAFETGGTVDEGDYLAADGATVVWVANDNQSYHNNIAGIALDEDLDQASSMSVDPSAILSMTDAGLSEDDYVMWGSNGGTLGSSSFAGVGVDRKLNRVWKVQITGSTVNIDNITIDLNEAGVLPDDVSDIALIIDDNDGFSSPVETTAGLTFVSEVLSISNLDLTAFAASDIFISVAFNLKEPGGIATAPAFWFRADAGVEETSNDAAEDGDAVALWLDQSGNGFNGDQSDPIERPTFSSTSTINFNPVLSFDGSNSELPIRDLNYDLLTNTLSELTVFSVVKSDQTDEGIILSFDRSSFFRLALNHNEIPNFGLSTTLGTNTDDNNAATSASDGFPHLVAGDFNGSADEKNLYLDGTVEAIPTPHNTTGILGNTSLDPLEIPRFGYIGTGSEALTFDGSGSPENILNGDLSELIFYQTRLDPSDRLRVESYLALKYGLSLPGNYVSSAGVTVWDATSNSGYQNGVAGIGIDLETVLSQPQSKSETSGAVLTANDNGLSDTEFIIWGHDGDGTSLTTTNTGSRDARIEREWKFQTTGTVTSIDNISIDLSEYILLPSDDLNDYRLLQDNDADFSSVEAELTPISLVNGVLTFENIDVGSSFFITVGVDPDLDRDGIADAEDIDEDNDGIPDLDEGSATSVDTDGDGIADYRDLDSDNDGIGDLYESGIEVDPDVATYAAILSLDDSPADGVIDASETVGTDGLLDILQAGNADLGAPDYTVSNSDGLAVDMIDDFRDLDSDNNGLSDLVESGQPTLLDSDDNGVFDSGNDNEGDGISDEIDTDDSIFGSAGLVAQDSDGNGDPDFRDLDNDGDLTFDVVELGLTDDGAGRLDLTGQTDLDADGVYTTDTRDSDDTDSGSPSTSFGFISLASLQTGNGTDWYSYKSGDWDQAENWTQDPSGTLRINPGSQYPNQVDENVTILNGDEIVLNFDNLILSNVTVNSGGILNIGTTVNHNFKTINGRGTIKLGGDFFPSGDPTDFIADDGGTVEYIDSSPAASYELTIPRTFNNMVVNTTDPNSVVLKTNYTLNGNLNINSGTLQINDSQSDGFIDNTTPLDIVVNGDVTVEASGTIAVGDVDASTLVPSSNGIFTFHELELLGDFTNNGTVDFENLDEGTTVSAGTYRNKYPTATDEDNLVGTVITPAEFGVVEVLFTNGGEDQLVTLNGPTDFYRIEIAKGSSQTWIAEFNASAAANFRLLGRIAMNMSDDSDDALSIDNHRALGLETGILKLGNNIVINQISKDDPNGADPTTQGGNRNYIIDLDAQLWLSSNSSLTKSNDWGIHPFGKLKVTDDATLNFTGTSQRAILIDNQGVYEQSGGTVSVGQFRNKTGADGAPRGSFIMTGGTLNVGQADTDGNHGVFSIPWADQLFILKAADLANPPVVNITLDGNRGKDNAAIQIGVKDGNFDVGESTINVFHTSDTDYKMVSTSPLYNLVYESTGSGRLAISDIIDADDDDPLTGVLADEDDPDQTIPSPAQAKQPLVLLNDLIINDGLFEAGDEDVTIQNRLTIEDGGDYEPGTNTTFFNGTSPIQRIRLNAVDPVFEGFNNVVFSEPNTIKEFEGTLATVVIQGDLTIDSDVTLDDNSKVLQVNGNLSNSGLHETDPALAGRIELAGGTTTHEIGGDGTGQFKILTLNDANGAVFLADQEVDSVLNMVMGVLNTDIYRLTVNSTASEPLADDDIMDGASNNFDVNRMIQTAGNASDGGLSFLVNETGSILYPVGVAGKYTPATANFPSFTMDGSDDGFVAISPVNGILGTTNAAGGDVLTYYWKVDTVGIDSANAPLVTYEFVYDDSDTDTGSQLTDADNYFAGKVLDNIPYTRSSEGAEIIGTNVIAFDDAAFELETANYTAGEVGRFNGDVLVYYSKETSVDGSLNFLPDWSDASAWVRSDQVTDLNADMVIDEQDWHRSDNPNSPDAPGAGDVAVIGFIPIGDPNVSLVGSPHHINLDDLAEECAVLEFTQMKDGSGNPVARDPLRFWALRPSVLITGASGQLNAEIVKGEGEFFIRFGADPDFSAVDLGFFNEEDSSIFFYEAASNRTYANLPNEVPNLILGTSSWGRNDRNIEFTKDIVALQNVELLGDANLILSSGVTGDMTVGGDLIFFETTGASIPGCCTSQNSGGGAEIRFPNTGNARSVTIAGDISIDNAAGLISVNTPGTTPLEHSISINGSISQNTTSGGGLRLWTDASEDRIALNVLGDESESFDVASGDSPTLSTLNIDKGDDPSTQFTMNTEFTLNGNVSGPDKALKIQNGTLILNDPGIDIDINSGNSDFILSATSGLTIQDGTVRVTATGTGIGNGIRLNGKITLSGGDLILDGGASADNYIEYGSGGSAEIVINDANSDLVVGSHFRRSLFSDDGVITYTQTAGTAIFGANSAPNNSRGVFEIYNTSDGSAFTLSGAGSTFAIVNGQTNPDFGTFILNNGSGTLDVTFDNLADIDFGFNRTVAGTVYQNDLDEAYEINSDVVIPNIRIDNDNHNSPDLSMIIQPLTVTNNIQILNDGTLTSNDFNLTVNNGFQNDGTYNAGDNTTIFNGTSQTILGTTETVFNDLDINASADVSLSNNIFTNDLNILTGELNTGAFRASVLGDLNITTAQVGDGSAGGGISMESTTDPQEINLPDNEAEIDYLIIDNPLGVLLNDNIAVATILTIDDTLALNEGVLGIGDNRLIFDESADAITSSTFSANRMISVNGVKKSDGVERRFVMGVDAAPFLMPVGTPDKYTPVTLDVDASDEDGSVLIKPINERHPSAFSPFNVLNYYWVASSTPVNGFLGEIIFQYLEEDTDHVSDVEEAAWIGARLIAPNWSKPPAVVVDDVANTITFDQSDLGNDGDPTIFDGEFTAGTDIPDILLRYRSVTDGSWNDPSNWDLEDDEGDNSFDDGNGLPTPGSQVFIRAADTVTMVIGDNDQNVFSVEIEGTLDVGDSDGHNFGDISGTGVLKISNPTLPGGNYDDFFTTSDGSIDLSGTGSYTISPDFTSIRGLIVSGSGVKTLPTFGLTIGDNGIIIDGATLNNNTADNSITIIDGGDITINSGAFDVGSGSVNGDDLTLTTGTYTALGGALDLSGSLAIDGGIFNAGSGDINLGGNLTYNSGTYNNDNGKIVFDGSGTQTVTGDFSTNVIQDLEVNKPSGNVELAASATVYVSNLLELRGGLIDTRNTGAVFRLQNGIGSYSRTTGYINGPIQVSLSNDNNFTFPIGKGGNYKPLILKIADASQTPNPVIWEVEYYDQNALNFVGTENTVTSMSAIEMHGTPEEQVVNMNQAEFWRMDTQGGSAVAERITLDISNLGVNQDNINDQEIQTMFWNEGLGQWDHMGGVASGTPSSGNVVSDSLLSFSEKIVTTASENIAVVLPVEMLYFSGEDDKGVVQLDWATATEIDNDYFEVQRSQDGRDWEVIGVVTGAGTTVEEQQYDFSDFRPYVGNSYYRLRQVDYDGQYAFTDIILVNVRLEPISFNVYPNPVRDVFTVDIKGINANEETPYSIVSLQGAYVGQGVLRADETGRISEQLSLSYGQPAGIYILRVATSQRVLRFNLIKK